MIKRNPSNNTVSLVNDAQNEHFNVSEGIRTDVPVTNTNSVIKSINFLNRADGAYVLRNPLVLKERIDQYTWYLFDKVHLFNFPQSKILSIINTKESTSESIRLKYFDKKVTLNDLVFNSEQDKHLTFIDKIISVNTFTDYTLVSISLDAAAFSSYIENFNVRHSTTYSKDLVYENQGYGTKLYRFLKIYQNIDSEETEWIVEIVHPEFNSITSATDTQAALDVNLLLDNPYAIRDLYNYGYLSTTKMLAYVPKDLTVQEINNSTIYQLTESLPQNNKGFKLLVSIPYEKLSNTPIILKAFLTTTKTTNKYYCVWEESINGGVDWTACSEFINKFENSLTNPIVTKIVVDLTSADFEKTLKEETLEQASSYLVEKKMVRLNYKQIGNTPVDLSEEDFIKYRPDVLFIQSPNPSKLYRFQVYVDTEKEVLPPELTKTYSLNPFNSTSGEIEPGVIEYSTGNNAGGKKVNDTFTLTDPEIVNNRLTLYGPRDLVGTTSASFANTGNYLRIDCKKSKYYEYVKQIKLVGATFATVGSSYAYMSNYTAFSEGTPAPLPTTVPVTPCSTNIQFSNVEGIGYQTFIIANAGTRYTSRNPATITCIGIEVTYVRDTQDAVTSTYLASTTGYYQIPQSEEIKYAEYPELDRKQLFYGQTYEYEHQILSFDKYNLYISDVDAIIFKILKKISFSTEIVNVIAWRDYLLVFTEKDISLLKYNYDTDTYVVKTLTNSIGVPKKDAKTIACILNSVYFKSGYKIYRLVPNLYASNDDILNVHSVSDKIDILIEETLSPEIETANFVYSNAYYYYLFIPIYNKEYTYCFVYDYINKVWNLLKYPAVILNVEHLGLNEEYLKTSVGLYFFKDTIETLLNTEILKHSETISFIDSSEEFDICYKDSSTNLYLDAVGASDSYTTLKNLAPKLPYTDFLDNTLQQIYQFLENSNISIDDNAYKIVDITSTDFIQMTPIEYLVDFGQKSSTYTMPKTFLETKISLATLHPKDTFPFELYVTVDGLSTPLHWDVTTDSALWKNSFLQKGTLSTMFSANNAEYNGIMRQLIIKYSGKGKTIHHLIHGKSKYAFSLYSMDVRSRLLPKKQ